MQVNISGQNMNIGDALNQHITDSLTHNVKKYFENAVHANVNIVKDRHNFFITDIFVNQGTGTGVIIKATSQDSDAHRSVSLCIEKINKQLRRYKERIKNNHKDKEAFHKFADATKYIISPFEDKSSHADAAPTIIAEMEHSVDRLTVADAVMRMDLLEVPALMFINKANGCANMVYYRADGNIAWVQTPKDMTLDKK